MMKSNGPSHLVGHKSSKEDHYPLEGNQCVCADVKSVFEIHETENLDTADVIRDVIDLTNNRGFYMLLSH